MTCAHHWIIQPAKGPISRATCKLCREKAVFQNTLPLADTFRNYEVTQFSPRSARAPRASHVWFEGH